jgi:hypothetical protein
MENPERGSVRHYLKNPLLALSASVVFAGVALSGRFSVSVARILLGM